MSATLTLYVVHTTRAAEIATELVANVRWASLYPCFVVLVVDKDTEAQYESCGADLVHGTDVAVTPPHRTDFRFFDGVRAALNINTAFEQVICLRDDAIFINRGLDKWTAETCYRDAVDFLAVADRNYYGETFLLLANLFSRWRVPHEIFDRVPSPTTAHTAVFCMTAKLAKELFYRHLLVPPGYTEWPLPFGCYITWMCRLLLLSTRLVGSMDKPVAPFYVNDGWGGSYNAPPYLLHSQMLVYWSICRAAGFNETDSRDWATKRRNAP